MKRIAVLAGVLAIAVAAPASAAPPSTVVTGPPAVTPSGVKPGLGLGTALSAEAPGLAVAAAAGAPGHPALPAEAPAGS